MSTPVSCLSCFVQADSSCNPTEPELARCIGLLGPIDPNRLRATKHQASTSICDFTADTQTLRVSLAEINVQVQAGVPRPPCRLCRNRVSQLSVGSRKGRDRNVAC
jgi:hypothetical protein